MFLRTVTPGWQRLSAQSALPAPIATRLRETMAQVMTNPDVLRTFEASGSLVAYQDAPQFADFVASDSARLIAEVKEIGTGGIGSCRVLTFCCWSRTCPRLID